MGDRVAMVDCHVHTDDSFDASSSLEAVLGAAAEADLDGLVVTDHDAMANARRAVDRAPAYDLVALPGVEVSTADGHLLAIGVRDRPTPGRPLAATVAAVRDQGGVAVVPHPFQRTRHGVGRAALSDCDGIEVANPHALTGVRNRQARRFAWREGYPHFGGSDAHRPADVGLAATAVAVEGGPPTASLVLEAMREGRTRAVGGRASRRRYVRKLAGSARRKASLAWPVG